MKKLFFVILSAAILITSCKKNSDSEIQGDTDIPLNQVGNTFSSSASVNGNYVDIPGSCVITKSEGGLATFELIVDLKSIPALAPIDDLIPDDYKDGQGRLNVEGKVKITSDGIMDYTNADDKPLVMVKYDCKVGDQYTLKKSNGSTITRSVTAKSDTDDFEWGFYLIKTITVEQDSRIPGISKIVYKFNHKFGLVYLEAIAEDGTKFSSLIYPQNY
jgi:hypothetical protein